MAQVRPSLLVPLPALTPARIRALIQTQIRIQTHIQVQPRSPDPTRAQGLRNWVRGAVPLPVIHFGRGFQRSPVRCALLPTPSTWVQIHRDSVPPAGESGPLSL